MAALSIPARAKTVELPSADKAIELLGLTAAEKKQLRSGQTVTRDLEQRADQLAFLLARIIPHPIDALVDGVRRGKIGFLGQTVLAMQEIDLKRPLEDSFKTATFGSNEMPEIDGLLNVHPGARFNLSGDEMRRFADLRTKLGKVSCKGDPGCSDAVNSEYRGALMRRMRAYLDGGVASLATYARERGMTSSPGDALSASLQQSRFLAELFPAVHRSLQAYPAADAGADAEDHYFWVKLAADDRPLFILVHRRLHVGPGGAIAIDREIFAGHSFNAAQILAGVVPDGAGTMAFYTNRAFTDQLAGIGQSMRQSIGRKRLKQAVQDYFDTIAAGGGATAPR